MLSLRQTKALDALLTHPSKAKAAEAAGVTARTITKYLSEPEFSEAYQEAVEGLISETSNALKKSAGAAIATLLEVAEDSSLAPSARVSAARALLDANIRYHERSMLFEAADSCGVPAPIFYYDPKGRKEPPIAPEVYAEVEALLMGDGISD